MTFSNETRHTWLSLVTEHQLTICACAAMTEHEQIVSCCSVTNDNHAFQIRLAQQTQ